MNSTLMKSRLLPSLTLLIVLLAACSPAAAVTPEPSVEQQPAPPVAVEPTATAFTPADTAPVEPATEVVAAPTEAVAPLPVATSRGDNLEATDPRTVNLASGGLQFVEFFRFTWATCRAMAPMVHGLEAKYYGRINFVYLDADDIGTDPFQRQLGFYYQPEVYLLDGDGNVLQKWVGFTSQEEFESVFAQYLQ